MHTRVLSIYIGSVSLLGVRGIMKGEAVLKQEEDTHS